MIYVQLKKALYSTLQAALLFFGNYYPTHYMSGDSQLMTMTDALPTK